MLHFISFGRSLFISIHYSFDPHIVNGYYFRISSNLNTRKTPNICGVLGACDWSWVHFEKNWPVIKMNREPRILKDFHHSKQLQSMFFGMVLFVVQTIVDKVLYVVFIQACSMQYAALFANFECQTECNREKKSKFEKKQTHNQN